MIGPNNLPTRIKCEPRKRQFDLQYVAGSLDTIIVLMSKAKRCFQPGLLGEVRHFENMFGFPVYYP